MGGVGREVVHISMMKQFVKFGDIVLFKSSNAVSAAQRGLTGSEWDHVGMVIKQSYMHPLELLEATGEGVVVTSLVPRLRGYGMGFAKYMAVRRLDVQRTWEMQHKLSNFVRSTEGKPYSIRPSKLMGALTNGGSKRKSSLKPSASAKDEIRNRLKNRPDSEEDGGAALLKGQARGSGDSASSVGSSTSSSVPKQRSRPGSVFTNSDEELSEDDEDAYVHVSCVSHVSHLSHVVSVCVCAVVLLCLYL